MTKTLKALSLAALLCLFISSFSACKKEDEGLLPNITFKLGGDYTAGNVTVAKSTNVKIGINASKAEDKDVLTKFTIVRAYDNGADSTIFSKDLSGSEGDNYSYDLNTTTRSVAGTEKYTFTVVNRDGLINKASLTLTVN